MAEEKRKQAQEELKATRERARAEASAQETEDTSILDNLLEKLRNGDSVGRKRRDRQKIDRRGPTAPLDLNPENLLASGTGNDTADLARDMLARLKSDGFDTTTPTSPTSSGPPRRSRRRPPPSTSFKGIAEELEGAALAHVEEESVLDEGTPLSVVSEIADKSPTDPEAPATEQEPIDTTDRETTPGAEHPT